jgi:ribosomal protein S12 methylthiotransferase accessory factor
VEPRGGLTVAIPVAGDGPPSAGDRARTPRATLGLVRPHFPDLGITRVGLLTGLDRIGIPVGGAVRPNGLALSVHLGKGLDDDQALVSAAMEAVEVALSERVACETLAAPARLAGGAAPVVDLARLTRCRVRAVDPDAPLPMITGVDLVGGGARHVPLALVRVDHTGPVSAAFDLSSDGLASGNTPDEAVLHGLLELVERDAVALAGALSPEALAARRLSPRAFGDPVVADLAARLEARGRALGLFDVTTDVGVPVITALLAPAAEADPTRTAGAATAGHAAHPDPARAATSAILEACQARLAATAGARDDIGLAWYAAADLAPAVATALSAPSGLDERVRDRPEEPADPASRIAALLDRLVGRGIREVVAVHLPSPIPGIHAVRMIVPGLEIGPGAPGRSIGRRLLAAHLGALG